VTKYRTLHTKCFPLRKHFCMQKNRVIKEKIYEKEKNYPVASGALFKQLCL